jgi:catechol 2,3-dioxygenase-like lactoylglutathione lyase family enzyme
MTPPAELPTPGFHHVSLSVTDPERSAVWFQALLGDAAIVNRVGPDWHRVRMQWPNGLVIGLTCHDSTAPESSFDHTRVGLDHLGLGCPDEASVRAWADRLDTLGFTRGPVEDAPYGWAVTARDPDGIAVEFFAPKG